MQEAERATRTARADRAAASKEATGAMSQFYGVSLNKSKRMWQAKAWHGGKQHTIGYFEDEVAAARAVDKWLLANGRRRVNLDEDGLPLERQSTYASIYVGVYKHKGNWQARIKVNKRDVPLGTFVTQREAALAYDRRARKLRNPRRGTNFRLDGTCNEVGKKGKVLTQVEEDPAS